MKFLIVIPLTIMTVLLSGCLYPNDQLAKNNVPNDVQLNLVQQAVEQYAEMNQGRVPIKTKENETPIFEKYVVDFTALKQQGVLSSIPGTAFENGGVYQYVLITPEEDPRVKLIDLRTTEKIRSLTNRINIYRSEHSYPPFGEEIENGAYTIDYKKIGLDKQPYVVSPYSQKNLPIVMNSLGELSIDYRMDLYEALNNYEHSYTYGDDIRLILAENYPFVPAYSLPFTIENGDPIFFAE